MIATRPPRNSAIVLAVLLAAGCGSPPPYQEPDVDLHAPAHWTAGPDSTGGAATTAITASVDSLSAYEWWRTFDDPRLDSLVVEALDHNYNLQAAATRIDQAAALARIAGADLYPQFNLSGTARRAKQNFIGLPIPGGDGGVLSTTTTSLGVSLETSWEIDLWGRIRAGKSAALADVQASYAEVAGAHLSLVGQTAKAWFGVIEARQQLELAEETVESYERSAAQVRERFNLGVRTSLDLRLALTQLAQAEALRELRIEQLDFGTRQLEVILGRYPAASLEIPNTLPPLPGAVPAGLPAELLARRPDLAAAERRLAAVDKRIAEARRSLYPRISLTGSAGTASTDLEDIVDTDFNVWNLVGNLFQPLFQGGRLRANVALQKARFEEALAGFGQSALAAFAEVEHTLVAEERLALREAALLEASEQSEGARRLALEQYRFGLVDYIFVLESERRALIARSDYLAVRRARLDNRVDLHLALGGGFRIDDIPGLEPAASGANSEE
jgi:NodT family efflux transporter outer membrane factor (OMF) lipoprotein